jgi:copper chaperone
MEKTKMSVPNISCGHCVMNIKRELGEIQGVKKVEGDPKTKEIVVDWDAPASLDKIKSTLKEINYPAAE